jgi:hypothetical protein
MVEAIYCFDTATVRFAIFPEGARTVAEIREEAMRDLFGANGGGDSLVRAYFENEDLIRATALRRYCDGQRPVLLETADFLIATH